MANMQMRRHEKSMKAIMNRCASTQSHKLIPLCVQLVIYSYTRFLDHIISTFRCGGQSDRVPS